MNPKVWIFLGLTTVLLLIAGIASPGWILAGRTYIGIWYSCRDGVCQSNYWSRNADTSIAILLFQITGTAGVVFGIVGFILTCVFVRQGSDGNRAVFISAGVCFLLACILSWIPTGFGILFLSIFGVPYSLILMALGATLSLVIAIMAFVTLCQRQTLTPDTVVTQAYPMQGHVTENNTGYPAQSYPAQGNSIQDKGKNENVSHALELKA
ncbi:hypothetical protein ScPMuIL_005015 [Solemya velum]